MACAESPQAKVVSSGSATTAPVLTTPVKPDPAAWDPRGAEATLAEAITLAVQLQATPVLALWDALTLHADPSCPNPDLGDAGYYYSYWYAQCVTEDGATFTGYAYYYDDERSRYFYNQLYCAGSVVDPEGNAFTATGRWSDSITEGAQKTTMVSSLKGFVAWTGDGQESNWIGQGLEPDVDFTRTLHAETGVRTLDAKGSISALTGEFGTVTFTDVSFSTDSGCLEPNGTITLRAADGSRFDLAFGGADCLDGCADVTRDGEPVGTACGDFSPWALWEAP